MLQTKEPTSTFNENKKNILIFKTCLRSLADYHCLGTSALIIVTTEGPHNSLRVSCDEGLLALFTPPYWPLQQQETLQND